MYQSPVPLIVIRASAPALIEVNGHAAGECGPEAQAAFPAGDTGDYYITARPLLPGKWAQPLTRKLSIDKGAVRPPEAPDLSLCVWPGGVYELTFMPPQEDGGGPAGFPRELDQLSYSLGRQRRTLTLYREDGLKLLAEDDGRPGACISLGAGEYGALALYSACGRQFAAATLRCGGEVRLLMLDAGLNAALEISAEQIYLEEDCVSAIDGMGTLMGHQRRTRYVCSAGAFEARQPETGFFTREYAFPGDRRSLVTAFCEAVREGLGEEAMSYASPSLRADMTFAGIRDFLGGFECCRPPLSDKSGALMGLISAGDGGVSGARLYEFSFEEGLISDIGEV